MTNTKYNILILRWNKNWFNQVGRCAYLKQFARRLITWNGVPVEQFFVYIKQQAATHRQRADLKQVIRQRLVLRARLFSDQSGNDVDAECDDGGVVDKRKKPVQ